MKMLWETTRVRNAVRYCQSERMRAATIRRYRRNSSATSEPRVVRPSTSSSSLDHGRRVADPRIIRPASSSATAHSACCPTIHTSSQPP